MIFQVKKNYFIFQTLQGIFPDLSIPKVIFHDFPDLENFYFKFHDFPDFARICTYPDCRFVISTIVKLMY